jgi:trimeric autotransporter adhesin
MSDSTSYVLAYPDATILSGRTLAVGTGLSIVVGGSTITVSPGERLDTLAALNTNGFVAYTASTKTYTARSFVNGQGITIGNVTAQGNVTISQLPGSTVQKIQVNNEAGDETATSSVIRFVAGTADLDVSVSTDGGTGDGIVTISSTNPLGTVTSVGLSSSNAFITVSGSPVTSSGTLAMTIGTLSIAKGGTAGTTRAAAFNNISPITSVGDTIIGSGVDTAIRLPIGASGRVLTSNGTTATWAVPATSGTVTSVGLSSSNAFLTISGTPVTASGTLAITVNTLSIAKGGTGQVTAGAAFNALSPITSTGDLIIGTGVNTASRLAIGTTGKVLTSNGTTAAWTSPSSPNMQFGIEAGITTQDTPITVLANSVQTDSIITLSLGVTDWAVPNLTPGVDLISINPGVGFDIRALNVGGVNMASTIDVMWVVNHS